MLLVWCDNSCALHIAFQPETIEQSGCVVMRRLWSGQTCAARRIGVVPSEREEPRRPFLVNKHDEDPPWSGRHDVRAMV